MDAGAASVDARNLRQELAANPGRLALLVERDAASAARWLAEAWDVPTVEVGRLLTAEAEPPPPGDVKRLLSPGSIFVDLEILFSKDLRVNPLSLLRQMTRTAPRAFLWPGQVSNGSATYSRPERPDHFEERLSDAIIIRAREPRFPDEAPFTIERIP